MNEWHNSKVHYAERFICTLQDGCFDIFVTKVIRKLMNDYTSKIDFTISSLLEFQNSKQNDYRTTSMTIQLMK